MPFHLDAILGFSEPSGSLIAGVPSALLANHSAPPTHSQLFTNKGVHEIQFRALELTYSELTEEISPPINDLPV